MTATQERMLPLYEGKMIGAYDHRAADVVKSDTALSRQNQPRYLSAEDHSDVEREPLPDAWVREEVLPADIKGWLLAFCDVTSSTNERTMIACAIPRAAVGHTAPLVFARGREILLAVLNSFAFDYSARQKVAGNHLTYTYLRQTPVPSPNHFHDRCPWDRQQVLASWLTERVLRLSVTSRSMTAMAECLGRTETVVIWEEGERGRLRAELDAAMFHLYGIARDDVDYIMETFPIVKRKDEASHGRYRTKEAILEVYDAMQAAIDTSVPYVSPLDHALSPTKMASSAREEAIGPSA